MANKSDRYQMLALIKVFLKNNVKKYLMTNQTSDNNKRIAKNMGFLYPRISIPSKCINGRGDFCL